MERTMNRYASLVHRNVHIKHNKLNTRLFNVETLRMCTVDTVKLNSLLDKHVGMDSSDLCLTEKQQC